MLRYRMVRVVIPVVIPVVIVALLAGACSEKKDGATSTGASGGGQQGSTTTLEPEGCDPAKPVLPCLISGSTLDPYLPATPTEASGEPIKLGTINQETGATGAYPELTLADRAAVRFVDKELGGVDRRPIELITCDTKFLPAGSQSCAQQMIDEGVVAVVGGVDAFGTGIDVLEQNAIPFVGGIPISMASVQSPVSFQFSGKSWGTMLAFADYAANDLKAKRVSILYDDFGSIADAAQYGKKALESLGAEEVKMVPMPLAGADFLPLMTTAADIDPDAVISLTADTGCVPTFQAAHDLDLRAAVFITGAYAAAKIVDDAGTDVVEGTIFNAEGPVNPGEPVPDVSLYYAVIARYGDRVTPVGSATVSFRTFMNLYALLALGLVLTYRASGVVNFAHGALGVFAAYSYYEARESGELVLPMLGATGEDPARRCRFGTHRCGSARRGAAPRSGDGLPHIRARLPPVAHRPRPSRESSRLSASCSTCRRRRGSASPRQAPGRSRWSRSSPTAASASSTSPCR